MCAMRTNKLRPVYHVELVQYAVYGGPLILGAGQMQ